MEALEIKRQAEAEGIRLILDGGKLKARGSHEVVNKWLPVIKKHKADLMTVLSVRLWTQGNPYTCTCGRATGWTTDGQPLCPACVPPADPEKYRRDMMLTWADELEAFALNTDDEEMRKARMSVVYAIREELHF